MRRNTLQLSELQNLNILTPQSANAIKGGDDKRPPRPGGDPGIPGIPPGGVLPNSVIEALAF